MNNHIKIFLTLIAISLPFYTVQASESVLYKKFYTKMLSNPTKVLSRNDTDCQQMNSLIDSKMNDNAATGWNTLRKLTEGLLAVVKQFETRNPIFLLNECALENSDDTNSHCLLSRFKYPWARKQYRDRVVDLLSKKRKDIPAHVAVEYVDFGSGDLFQLSETLFHFLKNNNSALLNVHMIDPEYKDWTLRYNKPVIIEDIEKSIETGKADAFIDRIDVRSSIAGVIICNARHVQLEKEIKEFYPSSQVSLYAYPNTDIYMLSTELSKQHADVISAIDIPGNSFDEYRNLCIHGYTKKPTVNNLAFIKMKFDDAPDFLARIRQAWVVPAPKKGFWGNWIVSTKKTLRQECTPVVE